MVSADFVGLLDISFLVLDGRRSPDWTILCWRVCARSFASLVLFAELTSEKENALCLCRERA